MRKKVKQIVAVILAVILCLATFAGCQSNDNGNKNELVKDYTVNVYSWWDPTHTGILGLQKGFEQKYADYNVKLNFVKISDYYPTMLTKLAANKLAGGKGEKIDVMMLATDQVPNFAENEVIMPLTSLASEEYKKDLYPAVLEGLKYNEDLYAVARDVTTKCMILNTDVFAKYGIELPKENWTLEDFKKVCLEFVSKRGNDKVWGYSFDLNADPLYVWYYMFGGGYYDAKTNESLIDAEGSIAGVQFLYDLMAKKGIMTVSETSEYGKFSDAFIKGNAAMISGGLSQVDTVTKGGSNIKVIPLPKDVNGKNTSHVFINGWTIPSCTSNEAWSWKVLEYFSGAEGQAIACNAGMGLPGSQTADIENWIKEKEFRQYYVDALGYDETHTYPKHKFGSIWQTNFIKLMADQIWDVSGLTPTQIADICKNIDKTLTQNLKSGV